MKKRRFGIACVVIGLAILVTVLLISNGWRLFGFKKCAYINMVNIDFIKVTDKYVEMEIGPTYTSIGFPVGYAKKVEDGVMKVGVKYNLFIGKSIDKIKIPINSSEIDEIYIVGPDASKLIWDSNNIE